MKEASVLNVILRRNRRNLFCIQCQEQFSLHCRTHMLVVSNILFCVCFRIMLGILFRYNKISVLNCYNVTNGYFRVICYKFD